MDAGIHRRSVVPVRDPPSRTYPLGFGKRIMTPLTGADTAERIQAMNEDAEIRNLRRRTLEKIVQCRYAYNFSWLGRPVIQLPEDIVAMQELIWTVKPDLIIET